MRLIDLCEMRGWRRSVEAHMVLATEALRDKVRLFICFVVIEL